MHLGPDDRSVHFHGRWRAIQAEPAGLRPVSIALSATFTIDGLVPYLGCFLAGRGLLMCLQLLPYNQIYQSLLDPRSPLFTTNPDVILVLPRAEDLVGPQLGQLAGLSGLDPAVIAAARESALAEIDRLCGALGHAETLSGTLFCGTLPPPQSTPLGVLDAGHPASQRQLVRELNDRLFRFATGQGRPGGTASTGRTRLFDLANVVESLGTARAYDDRLLYLSRCPFSDEFMRHAAHALARSITPLFVAPAKVLVLDLDNTLWGGVIGEDGADGIAIGESGLGAAFAAFQEALLALRAQGVLLCVASKNNEADALPVLETHPGMRLRRHHLSAWRINWQPKSESIKQLAAELSLGLDSFVFLDDSPVECEEVRRALPQVHVVQLPDDPARYVRALRSLPVLDRMVLTAEDGRRAEQYAAERARRAAAPPEVGDPQALREHLLGLGLQLCVRRLRAEDVPRAAQLTQKTNQFNLTTIRRSESDIEVLRRDPTYRLWSIEVADRFGDYGMTGLCIVAADDRERTTYHLDTLLLSCRVLGRGVETGLLQVVLAELVQAGARRLWARFEQTAKNEPARGYLPGHGFRPLTEGRYLLEPLVTEGFDTAHLHITTDVLGASGRSGGGDGPAGGPA